MVVKLGWFGGMRMLIGRFSEEQSRMNCVSCSCVVELRSLLLGRKLATVLKRSGIYLFLMSEVALHLVNT